MYNHNKAQQSKNRVHISWDILYLALAKISPEEDGLKQRHELGYLWICSVLMI